MITQYTRLVVNNATGEIEHCTSQDLPFADNWEPVIYDDTTHSAVDFELEADVPDSDFGIGVDQKMIRARQIIDAFEIVGGQPKVKAGADIAVAAKVSRISQTKSIQESVVRVELADYIRDGLAKGGSSEEELLDQMRLVDSKIPESLSNLKTVKLIRIKKVIN